LWRCSFGLRASSLRWSSSGFTFGAGICFDITPPGGGLAVACEHVRPVTALVSWHPWCIVRWSLSLHSPCWRTGLWSHLATCEHSLRHRLPFFVQSSQQRLINACAALPCILYMYACPAFSARARTLVAPARTHCVSTHLAAGHSPMYLSSCPVGHLCLVFF